MNKKGFFILVGCMFANIAYATNYNTPQTVPSGTTVNYNPDDTFTVSTGNALSVLGSGTTANINNVVFNVSGTNNIAINATSGGVVTLSNGTNIATTGDGGIGINTSSAVITADSISISTSGNASAFGVKATSTPFTLTNSTIQTSGSTSFAMTSNGITARMRGTNLQVTATGDNSAGLNAVTGSQFFLTSSTVLTTGTNSNGAQVIGGSGTTTLMTLTSDNITTQGINSYGISAASTNTQLTGSGLTITTNGTSSHGTAVQGGASLSLSNSSVTATGAGASALAILTAGGNNSTVTITGGSLSSNQSDTITAQGGMANLTLQNGTTVNNGSGNLLNAAASSNLTFTGSSVTLTGNVLADSSSTVNMSLLNGSMWTGVASNLSNLNIDPSIWLVTGSSSITGTLTNAGTINFTSGGGFKTLTVGSYVGQNGMIGLNTFLGGDNSPSDNLTINGGSATGATTLNISNAGGLGAATPGNGILVVNTINGGTTSANAFVLGNTVIAGPYQYTLFRGSVDQSNANNYYLRTAYFDPSAPASAFIAGEPFYVPNYRPEVSLYTALPSIELLYSQMLLDTFHQRVGDEEQLQHFNNRAGGWVRVINQGGNINNQSIFEQGPNFNYHFLAVQLGIDIYHREHMDGSRDEAGIFGAIGNGNGNVEHFTGIDAGHNKFNAISSGAYWTHFGVKNWYVDAIIQDNWFNAISNGVYANITPHGNSFGLSLEGGYPLVAYKSFIIEPQLQMVYQTLGVDNASDGIATVNFSTTKSFAERAGIRFVNTWHMDANQANPRSLTTWVRVSDWHETNGNSQMSMLSNAGAVIFSSQLPKNWLQADVGITGQATKNISIYGTVGRDIYYANRGKTYNAILGVHVSLA